jgi:PleD family two-component response regulator
MGEETVIQCSYGMSRGAADSEKDIRSLIKRADEKLYRKKKTRQR